MNTRIENLETYLQSIGLSAEMGFKPGPGRFESVRTIDLTDQTTFPGMEVWLEWNADKGQDNGLCDGQLATGYCVCVKDSNGESHTKECQNTKQKLLGILKDNGYEW